MKSVIFGTKKAKTSTKLVQKMRFYNFRNFRTNFVLVFINPVCYQLYYVFSSYVALSIRDIFYFLSRMNTFCTMTSAKYFFFFGLGHKLLPSF